MEYHGEFFPGKQGTSCDQTCRDMGKRYALTATTRHQTALHLAVGYASPRCLSIESRVLLLTLMLLSRVPYRHAGLPWCSLVWLITSVPSALVADTCLPVFLVAGVTVVASSSLTHATSSSSTSHVRLSHGTHSLRLRAANTER